MQFEMLFPFLLSIAFLPTAAIAEDNLTEVLLSFPACSTSCSIKTLTAANCAFTDLRNCFCTNDTLQHETGVCVFNTCNVTDRILATTITQNQICNGVPKPWRGYLTVRASIIISAITYPIVLLRFITRIFITKRLWWDDWFILLAFLCMLPNTALPIYLSYHGFGSHFYDIPPASVSLLKQLYYIAQLFYVLVQNFPKFSILLLYLRIFPAPRFRKILYVALTWQTTHTIAFLLADAFQCFPVASLWDPFVKKEYCYDLNTLLYVGAGFSIFEDLAIILLPMGELRALNMGRKRKIALIVMFVIGSFACVTSMVRLKFVYPVSIDTTWESVDIVIWSQIETYTAVICACLMTLRPLILKLTPTNLFPSSKRSKSPSSSSGKSPKVSWGSKVSSRIKGSGNSYGERLDDEESIIGKDVKIASGKRESRTDIVVTTENTVEYEMHRLASLRAESEASSEICGQNAETGSKENLNDRSVLKV